ncbi:MAG: Hsp20/alpha crystallin family protein [Candidatus Yanofskybacteria bacterium]|nr:Hsp20/alpha crystallin family protein [Candidatus Yanofskybacteria bacterium]
MPDFFDDNREEEIISKRPQKAEGQLAVDVFQDDEHVIIQATIAGVGRENIDIDIANDMVTIKGVRKSEQSVRESNYYHQELYWGPFSRSIILPVEVDASTAKAAIKNGVLTIKLPRTDVERTRKIKISE